MLQGPNKVAMQEYKIGFSINSILRYLLVLKINIELNNSFATVLITTVPSLPPPADTSQRSTEGSQTHSSSTH